MDNLHGKFAGSDCKRMLARNVAIITGAIAECENHPCSFVNMGNNDAEKTALKIARSIFSKGGDNGYVFRVIFNDSKDFQNSIKQVINESSSTCPFCTAVTCKVAGA